MLHRRRQERAVDVARDPSRGVTEALHERLDICAPASMSSPAAVWRTPWKVDPSSSAPYGRIEHRMRSSIAVAVLLLHDEGQLVGTGRVLDWCGLRRSRH